MSRPTSQLVKLSLLSAALLLPGMANPGAYINADESFPDIRTHAHNFEGSGGELSPIRVCLDIQSNQAMAEAAEPALLKAIATINRFRSLGEQTKALAAQTDVPAGFFDFESVLLHEMLHGHGLAHPNHGSESGLPSPFNDGTKSANGPNNSFDQGAGVDGLHGSNDDVRGDDQNLHWYGKGVNNPGLLASIIDESSYARALSFLPAGHLYAANAGQQVLAALGFANAEAVMQQGAAADEAQRHLQHDDLATLRFARAGLDGVQGTVDDYRTRLEYRGRVVNPQGVACQIAVRFDNSTGFATTGLGSFRLSTATPNHWALFEARIRFNPSVNWYFSPAPNTITTILSDLPDPSVGSAPITVRVRVEKAAGNTIATNPLGKVEVRDGPAHLPTTARCSFNLLGVANEVGECLLTPLASGNKTLVADYLGYGGFDGGSDSEAHVVNGTVEFSGVSVNQDPPVVNVPANFSWTLAAPAGDPTSLATGTVIVKSASSCFVAPTLPAHQCSASLPAASCSFSFNTSGTHTIQFCYSGDGAHPIATASISRAVLAGRATSTSITSSTPNPSSPLAPVVVSVSVAEAPSLGGNPSGIVQVLDGPSLDPLSARCTIVLTGTPAEIGSCTLYPLRAGSRSLTASFAASGIWAASAGTAAQAVANFAIVRNFPATTRVGQGANITVNLDVSSFLVNPVPTGVVTVSDGIDQCQFTLPASECIWFGRTPGTRNLVASWPGNANHAPRTSNALLHTVLPASYPQLISNPALGLLDSNGASTHAVPSNYRQSALSADGRFVVFASLATNLVAGDSNGVSDVFIRDQRSGHIRRISTSASDAQGNGISREPTISANGRFVAFSSMASNLVPGDNNAVVDVFVKDLSDGSVKRATLKSDGTEDTTSNNFFVDLAPSLSADGRFIAFMTAGRLSPLDTSVHNDIYVRDLQTGALDIVSSNSNDAIGDFRSTGPASISADGRYVAFSSQAFNFAPNDNNDTVDVWRKDRTTRQIAFVSTDAAGNGGLDPTDSSFGQAISADGRYVAFTSFSNVLVPGDLNNNSDVFLKDLNTGAIELMSRSDTAFGNNGSNAAAISGDGRFVAFRSAANNLVLGDTNNVADIFVRDRGTNSLSRVNLDGANGQSFGGASELPSISHDGRFVSFESAATNLVQGDNNALIDVFVRDRQLVSTVRASAVHLGARSNGASSEASISHDGQLVAFASAASTMLPNDTNNFADIFLRNLATGSTTLISAPAAGTPFANGLSDSPSISGDGLSVAFRTRASNLMIPAGNGVNQLYVKQRVTGTVERISLSTSGSLPIPDVLRLGSSISFDGNLVLFHAGDSNLSDGDFNSADDVLLRNRAANTTTVISIDAAGTRGNGHSSQGQISSDGSHVVFSSAASNWGSDTNLVTDIYLKSLLDNSLQRVSTDAAGEQANGASSNPSISANARLIAFTSAASNLVPGDSNGVIDVFVKNIDDGAITRVSTDALGAQGTGGDCTGATSISANGRYVGFSCAMSNLVAADGNNFADSFIRDLVSGTIMRSSMGAAAVEANAASSISAGALSDAGFAVWNSSATNLVPVHDLDTHEDAFITQFATTPLIGTSTVITSHNPNPSPRDGAYVVAVSVTRASGTANVLGRVRISEGRAACVATLSVSGANSIGQCTLQSISVGTKNLSARYTGDQQFLGSDASSVSHTVLPITPRAPVIGTARAGNGEVLVFFTPPADNGSSAILSYTATCGARSSLGQASPITVTGLSNGTAVTCTVAATNSVGTGVASLASNSVTPSGVISAVGPFAYVPRNNSGEMSVLDLGSDQVIAQISGGSGTGIAVAPNGLRAYAVDQISHSVKVINTLTKTLVTSINVENSPWSAVVSPDNTRLYVTNRGNNRLSVIDTTTNTLLNTFNISSVPTGVVISPDGSKLYVGSATSTNLTVVALPSQVVTQFNVGTTPHALAISPDGSRVYFVNGQPTGRLYAFDTVSNAIANSVAIGGQPLGINISPDGTRIYASNNGGNLNVNGNTVSQIDAATLAVIATGATGPRPLGVDVHPDGSRVYVGNTNGTMSVLGTSGMTPIATIPMGSGDAVIAMGNFIARASAPNFSRKLAVGSITLPATVEITNQAIRVNFPQPFSATPIVIVQPSNVDSQPKALRIANVNGSGFDVLQVKPRGCIAQFCNGGGPSMTVHWLAALPGSYRLPDAVPPFRSVNAPNVPGSGVIVKVGSVLTMANQRATTFGGFAGFAAPSWQPVSFLSEAGEDFSTPPVVLSSIQSWNPANAGNNFGLPPLPMRPNLNGVSRLWFTTATQSVTATGFDVALESSSSDNTGAVTPGLFQPETIGYVAIENGVSTRLEVIGGAQVPLATINGSANGAAACTPTPLAFPSGSIVNAANLRVFAGLHTRGEDDGGWLRSCGVSDVAGSSFNARFRVDEDEDLSTDRSHTISETVGTAVFGGDFITTPVSLAYVKAQRSGAQIDITFGSATEIGHLGYRVWGRSNASADWRALHEDLIVSRTGDSFIPISYQRSVPADGVGEIRIEDIDITGASRMHAGVVLDESGNAQTGAAAMTQPLNWTAIRASNAANPARRAANSGATGVLASVKKAGIQRASFADLSAAGFVAGANTSDIALLENGQSVPRFIDCGSQVFGPGCSIEWLASTRPSLYGSERIYQIKIDPAAAKSVSSGALVSSAANPRVVPTEFKLAPNRSYSFSAPGNDPWFDQRLVASTAPVELSRSFSLAARAPGPVTLNVNLWGGTQYAGSAPDHSIALLLNGQLLVERRFDGLIAQNISVNLSDAQIQPSNMLTLRVLGNTGYPADVVMLDGFNVNYSRYSSVSEGELSFGAFNVASASDALFSDGLEVRSGFAVNGISASSTIWSQLGDSVKRDQASSNIALDSRVSAVQISDAARIQTPALSPAAAPQTDFASADYLIITHPLFEAELQPIINLQQTRGYSVKVLRTDAIYAAKSAHQRSPQAIREAIAQINPRFVLLIGGDSYDYDDNLGVGSQSYLPTFYRVSNAIVRFAASDAPFVDANGDGKPERALGRIPARTVEELQRALAAIVQRGNMPISSTFATAGGSNANEHFDVHSRAMLSYLRQGQKVEFGLSDEIGLLEARQNASAALAGGSDFINYLGHSSPNRWALQNLLDTSQLGSIQRSGLPAIVAQWGCWNNYFVLPNQDTMSHALMLRSNQIAAAVIGSTSLAEDASHLALGTRFFDLIEDGRFDGQSGAAISTLGEALMAAKADLATKAPEHLESNYSITLFGDPAMRVR